MTSRFLSGVEISWHFFSVLFLRCIAADCFFVAFPPAQAVKSRKVLDDYKLDVTDTIKEMGGMN